MDNLTGRIGFIPVYETLPDARDFNEGKIIIDNSQKNPKLKYSKIIDNELVWVTIDGSDSPMIPATMADLDSHLRERDWNICGRLYSNAEFKKPVINTDFPPSSTTTTTLNPEENDKTTTDIPEIEDPGSDIFDVCKLKLNLKNCSLISDNPGTIKRGEEITLEFKANSGYTLRDGNNRYTNRHSITGGVINAHENGVQVGNSAKDYTILYISFTASGYLEEVTLNVSASELVKTTVKLVGCTTSFYDPTDSYNHFIGQASSFVIYPDDGYILPEEIVLTGATDYVYESSGHLYVENIIGDVYLEVICIEVGVSQFSLRMRTMPLGLEDEQQDSSDEEIYLSRVLEDLPEIPSVGELSWDSVCLTDGDYDISEDKEFCSIYEELINLKMKKLEQDGNTVDLGTRHYYDIISIRDVERGSSTIDLIALSGSNYTNVINLNSLIEFDTAGTGKFKNCTCNLTVGIEYTVSGKTYVKEHSFIPYFIDAGNLISNSFITNILDYVTLDFHKNCLRVFPMSKKVTECIISYCYIDYEGLF